MTTDLQRLPRRRLDVEVREDGSDSEVVAASSDAVHVLNPTARAIWELCDGATTVDEMVAAICQLFDVPRSTAFRDVHAVIGQLQRAGLVNWSDATPGDDPPR
jgi:hypothetical protein